MAHVAASIPAPLTGEARAQPLDWLDHRFGISPAVFAAYDLYRIADGDIDVLHKAAAPTAPLPPLLLGLTLLRMNHKVPKPTTEAAMTFGHHATRHVIALTSQQANAFIHRATLTLPAARTSRCATRGYVLVCFAERGLGVGFYEPNADGGTVKSLFPKAWAGVQMQHVVIPDGIET